MNFNLNSEGAQSYVTHTAPLMSHQTSQQTVSPRPGLYVSTPTMNFKPTDDATDDELEGRSPHDGNINSFHVHPSLVAS